MRAAVALMQAKKVQTAKVVTHILGLNAAGETTLDLPAGGGKSWCIPKSLPAHAAGRDRRSRGGDCGASPWDLVPGG
jgi:hypothetical protein